MMIYATLFIAETENKGRGVFTNDIIPEGTVIETAPVIIMPEKDRMLLDQTLLHDYIFEWGEEKNLCAMALGWVPVYNHSYQSNAEYEMDFENRSISVITVRQINAGEEVLINYNGDWNDTRPIWFDAE